jgi:hypothetical protein
VSLLWGLAVADALMLELWDAISVALDKPGVGLQPQQLQQVRRQLVRQFCCTLILPLFVALYASTGVQVCHIFFIRYILQPNYRLMLGAVGRHLRGTGQAGCGAAAAAAAAGAVPACAVVLLHVDIAAVCCSAYMQVRECKFVTLASITAKVYSRFLRWLLFAESAVGRHLRGTGQAGCGAAAAAAAAGAVPACAAVGCTFVLPLFVVLYASTGVQVFHISIICILQPNHRLVLELWDAISVALGKPGVGLQLQQVRCQAQQPDCAAVLLHALHCCWLL